jgi:hypothetical protein
VPQDQQIRGFIDRDGGIIRRYDPFAGDIGAIGELRDRNVLAHSDRADLRAGNYDDGIFDRLGARGHYCGASDQNLETDIGLLARGEQHKAGSREKSVAHELPMITWRGRIES